MGKISSFNFVTLNGFYKDQHDGVAWHQHNSSAGSFANKASQSDSILLFGRKTYEMMASFWPTPMAYNAYPIVAESMNKAEKIVCSNTLKNADWKNTKIINGNIIEQIEQLKKSKNKEITILGSGSLISHLTDAALIDEYRIMIDPIALGNGTPLFSNIKNNVDLKLTSSRIFKKDGIVLLTYGRRI